MLVSYFSSIINPKLAPRGPKTSLREKINSMSGLWGFIILIVIVLRRIYAGRATPTESAGVGAIGAILLAYSRKQLNFKILKEVATSTAQTTSMVFTILIGAAMFSLVFRGFGGDDIVAEFLMSLQAGVILSLIHI